MRLPSFEESKVRNLKKKARILISSIDNLDIFLVMLCYGRYIKIGNNLVIKVLRKRNRIWAASGLLPQENGFSKIFRLGHHPPRTSQRCPGG